jgi:hypothetical protein
MVSLGKWHNWVAVLLIVILGGFVLHQVGRRVPAVGKVVAAGMGS